LHAKRKAVDTGKDEEESSKKSKATKAPKSVEIIEDEDEDVGMEEEEKTTEGNVSEGSQEAGGQVSS
jgi:hypothetical protein